MAGIRLFDEPQESEWLEIPGDRRYPLSGATGRWGLAVCLESALASMGIRVSYPRIMGLLNIAFLLPFDPDFEPGAIIASESAQYRLGAALGGLGFTDTECSSGNSSGPEAAAEIDQGRPFLVREWNDQTHDWSIILGVAPKLGQCRGYVFAPTPEFREMDDRCACSLLFGPHNTAISEEKMCRQSLVEAVRFWRDDRVWSYDDWISAVTAPGAFAEGREGDEAILRHEWFSEMIVDARDAAALFFRELAQNYPVMYDPFMEITDLYERVVEALENRQPPLFSDMALKMLREPSVCSEWAGRLQLADRLETTAIEAIQRVVRMEWS